MAVSQNGYPVSPQRTTAAVPGTTISFPGGVRVGAVWTVLAYVAAELNRRVEKSTGYGCWGYAYRPIRGSSVTSNHASATAIDYNAHLHPLGVHGTFNAAQVRTIHAILAEVEHVVRWGGDYTGRVDEMHFEINAPLARVQAVADRLARKRMRPLVPGPKVTLQEGDTGGEVMWLQGQLNSDVRRPGGIKLDGEYGPKTAAMVEQFQHEQDLDTFGRKWLGVAGPKTIARLKSYSD